MSVSIIIPHQNNRKEWLKESVDSINKQTMPVREVIEACSNESVYERLNKSIKQARGDYILIFSDDDIMPENFIHNLYTFAEKHQTKIVSPFIKNIGGDGSLHGPELHPFFSSLIHKEVFQSVGGFDANMLQMADVDFWARAFEQGYRWGIAPDTFYYYRMHPAQDSKTGDYILARERYLKKHGKFLD